MRSAVALLAPKDVSRVIPGPSKASPRSLQGPQKTSQGPSNSTKSQNRQRMSSGKHKVSSGRHQISSGRHKMPTRAWEDTGGVQEDKHSSRDCYTCLLQRRHTYYSFRRRGGMREAITYNESDFAETRKTCIERESRRPRHN